MADQREVVVYARRTSWGCWLTKRLLKRWGYRFEVRRYQRLPSMLLAGAFHGTRDDALRFYRPPSGGGLSEIKALERSGALEHLVRGGV